MNRTPLASGFDAAFRHARLALCLWLFLLGTALLAWSPIRDVFRVLDNSPFRESMLKGWDPWGFAAFLAMRGPEIGILMAAVGAVLVLGALIHVFLTGGILRVLVADVERPVMRRLVAESAGLFRRNLWATARFFLSLLVWEGLLVAAPIALLTKIRGHEPVPNDFLANLSVWWGVVAGLLVFFNTILRLDLARIALARGDAPTARAAYRVAKQRIAGNRASAVGLLLFWLLAAGACQLLFSRIGTAMNPGTNGAIAGLAVVRQLGFLALMMLRVGWWASLLAWERLRRPAAIPASSGFGAPAQVPVPAGAA